MMKIAVARFESIPLRLIDWIMYQYNFPLTVVVSTQDCVVPVRRRIVRRWVPVDWILGSIEPVDSQRQIAITVMGSPLPLDVHRNSTPVGTRLAETIVGVNGRVAPRCAMGTGSAGRG